MELKKLRFQEGSGLNADWKNMLAAFEGALRLLHPCMPFLTEELWQRLKGGAEQHHLLDPRTGLPSRSPWCEVTVAASSCLVADVAAKAAFLLGADGPDWLDARQLAGRFVCDDAIVENGRWRLALGKEAACT